jgi:hypothetical protein
VNPSRDPESKIMDLVRDAAGLHFESSAGPGNR